MNHRIIQTQLSLRQLFLASGLLALSACSKTPQEAVTTAPTPKEPQEYLLLGFEEAQPSNWIKPQNSSITLIRNQGVTQGQQALELKFDSRHIESSIDIYPNEALDWSGYGPINIAFDAVNTSKHSIHLHLQINDKTGWNHTRSISMPADSKHTYYADLSGEHFDFDSGLREDPKAWKNNDVLMSWMYGKKKLDLDAIARIRFYVTSNAHDKSMIIDNLRIRKNPPNNPDYLVDLVDEFGQSHKFDYPTKIRSVEQLQKIAQEELADLAKNPEMPDRSKFGGWKNGPKLKATGFFRTEKIDGKWSLVDPEGYLFISTGIANIRIANTTTFTGVDFKDESVRYIDPEDTTPEDSLGIRPVSKEALKTHYISSEMRNNMFTWLPKYDDPLANHYSYKRVSHKGPMHHGETFSFYQANLERRYGESTPNSFLKDWEDVTIKRMKSWGFTSMGNWVDPAFYHKNQFPYFANGWIIGDFKTVTSDGVGWAPMPDPFDPEFERRARVTTKVISEEVKNNPWCIGVFIDNEKSWGSKGSVEKHYRIIISALTLDASESPTKSIFVNKLKEKYESIDKLNTAWETEITSWDEFAKGFKNKAYSAPMTEDFSMLLTTYTSKYFQVVHDALEEVMPNHMYLGVRMASWSLTPEGIGAATEYVDVMSYNFYREVIHEKFWEFLPKYDKPSLIGEFHMGAISDTGLYHPGLIHASDQKDRAKMFKDYMRSLIDNPYMIGGHWFQYIDSPITGRAHDGENYNVGFVTNADVPYAHLVDAAREVNRELYTRRFGNLEKKAP